MLLSVLAAACMGRTSRPTLPGCVQPTNTLARAELVVGHTVNIPPPCRVLGESFFAGPVQLTATEDGLQVLAEVSDPSFVPGSYRQAEGQRDVVVVFPAGEAPGRPVIELALVATPAGFRIDDVLPWETWGLRGPEGRFYFVMSYFDRERGGAEQETRISMHLTVRPAQSAR